MLLYNQRDAPVDCKVNEMTSEPLEIDRRLAEAASELGAAVSARQVKRWREAGLLPTRKKGLGQGLGSAPAEFLPGAEKHAACLAQALKDRRKLDEACLVCFWRGFSPRERRLKLAYAKQFRLLSDWLEHVSSASSPQAKTQKAGRILSRRSAGHPAVQAMRARLKSEGKGTPFSRVLSNALGPLLGIASPLRRETLLALGAEGLLTPIEDEGPLAEPDDLRLDWLKLSRLAEAVENSVLTELEQARDAFRFLFSFTIDFASLAARGYGLKVGRLREFLPNELTCALLGIPTMLIFRALWGKEHLDSRIEELRRLYPQVQAQNRFLDALPSKWHPFAAPNGSIRLAAAPDDERQALVEFVQEWAAEHPEDVALITETQEVNET